MIDGPLFSIGKLNFYPYGLCMALGIIACFVFLYLTMVKRNFNDEAIDKMLFIGIFATAFGIFMAMVFQSLYNYIEDPSVGFHLGEMTFQGGLIGGVVGFLAVWNLYVFVVAPRTKVKFLKNNMNAALADALPFVPVGITVAHSFGRLGCTFAGCCHGGETTAWYGIWMYTYEFGHAKVVPVQLFECLFLALLSAIMIVLYFKFNFKYNMGVYAIAYGVWRFVMEFVRNDHRGSFVGGLTPSQFWSIVMVVLGVAFFFIYKYLLARFQKHPELQPPVRQPKQKKALATGVEQNEEAEDEQTAQIAPAESQGEAEKAEPADNPQGAATGELPPEEASGSEIEREEKDEKNAD